MFIHKSYLLSVIGAVLLAGCSADEPRSDYGTGYLNFTVRTAPLIADIGVRAPEGYIELPASVLPQAGDLHFTLAGTYLGPDGKTGRIDDAWDRFDAYDCSQYPLECLESSYTATFSFGSETDEGVALPCFSETIENIHLSPDKTTTVAVDLTLKNACFRLLLDRTMTEYYTDIDLTVSTPDNDFRFTAADANTDRIIFVRTDRSLTLTGSARHAASGTAVTFPAQVINPDRPTRPATMHTITLRAKEVGSTRIEIGFDNSFEEIESEVIIP